MWEFFLERSPATTGMPVCCEMKPDGLNHSTSSFCTTSIHIEAGCQPENKQNVTGNDPELRREGELLNQRHRRHDEEQQPNRYDISETAEVSRQSQVPCKPVRYGEPDHAREVSHSLHGRSEADPFILVVHLMSPAQPLRDARRDCLHTMHSNHRWTIPLPFQGFPQLVSQFHERHLPLTQRGVSCLF